MLKNIGKAILEDKVTTLSEDNKDTNLAANLAHNSISIYEFLTSRILVLWTIVIAYAVTLIGSIALIYFLSGSIMLSILTIFIHGYSYYRLVKRLIIRTIKATQMEMNKTIGLVRDIKKK